MPRKRLKAIADIETAAGGLSCQVSASAVSPFTAVKDAKQHKEEEEEEEEEETD